MSNSNILIIDFVGVKHDDDDDDDSGWCCGGVIILLLRVVVIDVLVVLSSLLVLVLVLVMRVISYKNLEDGNIQKNNREGCCFCDTRHKSIDNVLYIFFEQVTFRLFYILA